MTAILKSNIDPSASLLAFGSAEHAGFRVLIVDDNRDAADTMALLLGELGNHVRTAYSGAEALQTFRTFRPDVVILDIGMPKLDGYQTARLIRAMPQGKHVLVIALTGYGSREARRLSQEAGIDHHSVKPVDVIILQGVIEVQAGAKRRARLEQEQQKQETR